MKTYEVINHTSVKAYGDTLPGLFENAACGLRDITVDPGTVRPVRRLNIEVEGENIEELLLEWLNDLIHLFHAQGFVPSSFKVLELEKQRLFAEVHGEHVDTKVHEIRACVKAITKHVIYAETGDGWSAIVVFDV